MINYLYHYAIPFTIVATKADKLPKTKVKPQITHLATFLKVGVGDVIAADMNGKGKSEILSEIEKSLHIESDLNQTVEEN